MKSLNQLRTRLRNQSDPVNANNQKQDAELDLHNQSESQFKHFKNDGSKITKLKKRLVEEASTSACPNHCPNHEQENLEFYSFTNDTLLCTNCLVMGKYAGHEVVNLKKANQKINSVLKDLLNGIKNRTENYNQWHQSISAKKEEFNSLIPSLQQKIKEGINSLRQVLDTKEKELIENINKMRVVEESQFESLDDQIKTVKEDVLLIGQLLKDNLQNLDELNLCFYYSQNHHHIVEFLRAEENFRIENINTIQQNIQLNQKFELSKFDESIKALKEHIQRLSNETEDDKTYRLPTQTSNDADYYSQREKSSIQHLFKATPTTSFLTSRSKDDHKVVHTEPSFYASREPEIRPETTRNPEESQIISNTFFEGYFDQIQQIRKVRPQSPAYTQESLQKSIQARLESEKKTQARRKLTGPSTNISEAYQRLQETRRDASHYAQQISSSLQKSDNKDLDFLSQTQKNLISSPQRSFLSPSTQRFHTSSSIESTTSKGPKGYIADVLTSYRGSDNKMTSPSLSSRLQTLRRENTLNF